MVLYVYHYKMNCLDRNNIVLQPHNSVENFTYAIVNLVFNKKRLKHNEPIMNIVKEKYISKTYLYRLNKYYI